MNSTSKKLYEPVKLTPQIIRDYYKIPNRSVLDPPISIGIFQDESQYVNKNDCIAYLKQFEKITKRS